MVTASSSLQEIVDFVYDFIMRQGVPCILDNTCQYIQGDKRCAVGCILEEPEAIRLDGSALYTKTSVLGVRVERVWKYTPIFNSAVCKLLVRKGYNAEQIALFTDLQIAHDSSWESETFRATFQEKVFGVCVKFDLKYDHLSGLQDYNKKYPVGV